VIGNFDNHADGRILCRHSAPTSFLLCHAAEIVLRGIIQQTRLASYAMIMSSLQLFIQRIIQNQNSEAPVLRFVVELLDNKPCNIFSYQDVVDLYRRAYCMTRSIYCTVSETETFLEICYLLPYTVCDSARRLISRVTQQNTCENFRKCFYRKYVNEKIK